MEYPYAECRNAAQIYKKVTQGIQPAGLTKVKDQELRDFIMLCIQHNPRSRPEARQLLKHPFFRSIRDSLPCNASTKELAERPLPELQVVVWAAIGAWGGRSGMVCVWGGGRALRVQRSDLPGIGRQRPCPLSLTASPLRRPPHPAHGPGGRQPEPLTPVHALPAGASLPPSPSPLLLICCALLALRSRSAARHPLLRAPTAAATTHPAPRATPRSSSTWSRSSSWQLPSSWTTPPQAPSAGGRSWPTAAAAAAVRTALSECTHQMQRRPGRRRRRRPG